MADTLDLDPEFGAIDLVEELEAIFDFTMSDEEAERCCTVGDLYDVLCAHTPDWDSGGGSCASSMVFYRLRQAVSPENKHSIRPSSPLGSIDLSPSALFKMFGKNSGLRLPSHPFDKPGILGSGLLYAGGVIAIVALFNAHWMIASVCGLIAGIGLTLVWFDPGRLPEGVSTFADLVRRTVPLNTDRLKDWGGRPADRWAILTALSAEHGRLQPDAISPETFLHRKSLEQASAA